MRKKYADISLAFHTVYPSEESEEVPYSNCNPVVHERQAYRKKIKDKRRLMNSCR